MGRVVFRQRKRTHTHQCSNTRTSSTALWDQVQQIRIGSENNNGYAATSLADAWDRYIPSPEGNSKGLQGLHDDLSTSYGDFHPLQNTGCRVSGLSLTACKISHVEDVEDGNPPSGGDMPSVEDKKPKAGRKEGRV